VQTFARQAAIKVKKTKLQKIEMEYLNKYKTLDTRG